MAPRRRRKRPGRTRSAGECHPQLGNDIALAPQRDCNPGHGVFNRTPDADLVIARVEPRRVRRPHGSDELALAQREIVLAVALRGGDRPVLLEGTGALCGRPLDARVLDGLDALVRDQIMSMKTTFTPGHYRRRVAGVLARRLVTRLFEQAS